MPDEATSKHYWKRGPRSNNKLGDGTRPEEVIPLKICNYRLPVQLMENVRVLASEEGVTMREFVETAIRIRVNKRKRRKYLAQQRQDEDAA